MEEILASIKRVIADDGAAAAARARRLPRAEAPPADPPGDDDVLELDDPVSDATGLMSSDAADASARNRRPTQARSTPWSGTCSGRC